MVKTKKYEDGSEYTGEMLNEKRHGKGNLSINHARSGDRQGSESYEGEWKDDKKEGKGILTKTILYFGYGDPYETEKYEGEFKADKKHGQGVLIIDTDFPGGGVYEKYEGTWENDMKHGKFVLSKYQKNTHQNWINDKLIE